MFAYTRELDAWLLDGAIDGASDTPTQPSALRRMLTVGAALAGVALLVAVGSKAASPDPPAP